MKKDQDRQKSYTYRRMRPLEFNEGDDVFLKVTPKLGLKGPLMEKKIKYVIHRFVSDHKSDK